MGKRIRLNKRQRDIFTHAARAVVENYAKICNDALLYDLLMESF